MSAPTVIPPVESRSPRTVIFLFDGTGDQLDESVTNVVEFGKMLYNNPFEASKGESWNHPTTEMKKVLSKEPQVVFYRPGIGTDKREAKWDAPDEKSTIKGWMNAISDHTWASYQKFEKAVAASFEDRVFGAYKELMEIYQEGDKICLFGFSRGAYTARAVAGMVTMFGLLPPGSENLSVVKTEYFKQPDEPVKWTDASKKAFAEKLQKFRLKNPKTREISIEFVGVWDTVNSVGILSGLRLPFTSNNSRLRSFRHAIALDERRARFERSMWGRNPQGTDAKEVWFAGAHCDVGGGSVKNGIMPNLANIPLRWMVRECFDAQSGIRFISKEVQKFGINPTNLYPSVKPRPEALTLDPSKDKILVCSCQSEPCSCQSKKINYSGWTEEQYDHADSLAPIYDQLDMKRAQWWPLELHTFWKWDPIESQNYRHRNYGYGREIHLPGTTQGPAQRSSGWWPSSIYNYGKSFFVTPKESKKSPAQSEGKIKVHRTVMTRMSASSHQGQYVPKATLGQDKFDINSSFIEWVD